MHPLFQALLGPWEWRLEVLAVIVPWAVVYTLGWRRLRIQAPSGKLARKRRLVSYWAGIILLAASLMSPVDRLGGQLLFMHMVQHKLTMFFAVPLLLLGNPFPFVLWGLPAGLRTRIGGLFNRDASFRRLLVRITRPGIAWIAFITVYYGWHDTLAYDTALRLGWVHDIQHITFFAVAMLFWWHVIGSAPHIHGRFSPWMRMAYVLTQVPPNMAVGISIAFSSSILYTYYESIPRFWGFSVEQDQMLGGAIMWIQGSEMFIGAALIILARQFMGGGRNKRQAPEIAAAARAVKAARAESSDPLQPSPDLGALEHHAHGSRQGNIPGQGGLKDEDDGEGRKARKSMHPVVSIRPVSEP